MTDYSPHLQNGVNEFNEDLQEFEVDSNQDELDSIREETSQESDSDMALSEDEREDQESLIDEMPEDKSKTKPRKK